MRRFVFLLAFFCCAPMLPAAQHSGTVRAADQPVPGATVTAIMGDKKLATSTGEDGTYSFRHLPAGVWLIEVEMFGFAKQGQPLMVSGDATSFDWSLRLKSAKVMPAPEAPPAAIAGATKAAPAPSTPTPPPSVPKTVSKSAAPAKSQSGFVTLALNAESEEAAAAPPAPTHANDEESGSSEAFLVTGSMSRGLDDARKHEDRDYSREDRPPSMMGSYSMGDFSGIGPTPTRGSSRGSDNSRSSSHRGSGRHTHSTKSRTSIGNRRQQSDIRGSAYFSLRNSALDARAYSLSGQPTAKPSYAQARFGVSAGGSLHIPKIWERDGTFVYFNYTGSHTKSPYNGTTTLPSFAERSGDFSQSVTRGIGAAYIPVTIYDPLTSQPFPGNRIPSDRINPASRGLLSYMPLPIYGAAVQNYQFLTSVPNVNDNYGFRVNQTLSRHDRLDFNVNIQTRDSETSTLYGFRDGGDGNGLSATAGYTHNFGPRSTNNLRGASAAVSRRTRHSSPTATM